MRSSRPAALFARVAEPITETGGYRRWAIGAGIAVLVIINLSGVLREFIHILGPDAGYDFFHVFTPLSTASNPYDVPEYRWSPLAAPIIAALVPLGFLGWSILHVAALGLLRPWWVAALVAVSWPFWSDLSTGNVGVFVFVAAWLALSGSRIAVVVYMGMCLLMPRPLMVPVLIWLLWKEPWTRIPFLIIALGQLGLVAVMHLLDDWVGRLTGTMAYELAKTGADQTNIGLSRLAGYWALLTVPFAALLTYRGRLGFASVAVTPYVLPFYLLFVFLELVPRVESRGGLAIRSQASEPRFRAPHLRDVRSPPTKSVARRD